MAHQDKHTTAHAESAHNNGAHSQDHGDVKTYLIGFVLSVILTVIPFWMVMEGDFSKVTTLWSIVAFALVQIWVHLKYFLHLNFVTEDGRASTISFLFSALIIFMVVGLSIWIIYESNAMMMY
ncbi:MULTISPECIES: cytochrome o ubiquinol oxidase subunit IV [Alteromonas]|jgi:cytochrome o ubiquinol oxidase operon protein cyoD|uniref:Cytochrome bo(3) ubiquinol oxidase subunit 4 n=1 Tax=Alteromonas stellipolaris TaxID=233316 RepID=A0AAW7Z472_9ALTE|nr:MULTISPECIES: cytochrome o ubiquinol oxidase subunit IV [Alteromonas]AMJ91527.1 cytochrome o ubiquinol oxidase subunit IV [Alteromonas sp. Mac2]ALM89646.1 Cytochrome O ubiquinol oxidase subunit IV [Alteromonas stellipolaris LMG 21856]AMJ75259.1 cytochrome o ubiquinol oxidase subunit IV [Alteromonas stellipolaris]AMJ87665.1 cytochrome o ubiquinol oxidase subunit IV [Alteromonas sp. Mac1]ANB21624.1 cytochrome o ubiquinol oxidase subunit IV [Alteromonas stellipolaris]